MTSIRDILSESRYTEFISVTSAFLLIWALLLLSAEQQLCDLSCVDAVRALALRALTKMCNVSVFD